MIGKEATTKKFDDDEWIWSLTEAEAITAAMQHQTALRTIRAWTTKGATHSNGRTRAKIRVEAAPGVSEGEVAALMTAMRQVGVASQEEELRPWQSSTSSFQMKGYQGRWTHHSYESKLTNKNSYGMIEWSAVRNSANSVLQQDGWN